MGALAPSGFGRGAAAVAILMTGVAMPAFAQDQTPRTVDAAQAAMEQTAAETAAEGPGGRTSYDLAYFAQYSPATALQIVQRVPGFAIQETDQNVRGFAGAAGNVVINGQRPSSKTDPIETILARIPANRVLRVEVGPGELFGSEYSGKPQVVNLVLNATGGIAGTMTGVVNRDFTGKVRPSGSVSALIRSGKSTFNVAGTISQFRTSDEGVDIITSQPSGALVEEREKVNHYRQPNAAVAAGWSYNGGENRSAHLNLRYAADRLDLRQVNHVFPVAGAARDDRLFQRYYQDDYELGGDATQPFAGGGLKLIGLATRRTRDYVDRSFVRSLAGAVLGGFRQDLDDRLEETLGRVVWSRPNVAGWSVEIGGEAVINKLTSRVDLFTLAAGGAATRIDLPVDDATVKERRGEGFVNAGRALSPTVRLDLGLTYERSNLTVSGDATAQRTLQFWKPKATIDWRPADSKWHVQASVQRTVAQLQFTDFISSAELSNERINGGNANLLPQRAWESLLTVERPVLGDGSARLELGYNRIGLVQDRVPTPDGFDAPGNLGDGTVLIVRPRLDVPLGSLGVRGGRLTLSPSYVRSRVEDPYTGRQRRFSGNNDFFMTADFRQDLGKFAWGATLQGGTAFAFYRLNEIDRFTNDIPQTNVFAEYRPDAATTITFQVRNILDIGQQRTRNFYTPNRRTPDPYLREVRIRDLHVIPQLTIKRNFG